MILMDIKIPFHFFWVVKGYLMFFEEVCSPCNFVSYNPDSKFQYLVLNKANILNFPNLQPKIQKLLTVLVPHLKESP